MQFYLAVDESGNTHIKGTQADARAINKDYNPIEVPTDKPGLMAWVQQMLDETLNVSAKDHPIHDVEPEGLSTSGDAETIEEILNEFVGLGGGDGDTIREYAQRIAGLNYFPLAQETKEPPETITEKSVRFEDEWENFPLALKCHYGALAMEECRVILKDKEVSK